MRSQIMHNLKNYLLYSGLSIIFQLKVFLVTGFMQVESKEWMKIMGMWFRQQSELVMSFEQND